MKKTFVFVLLCLVSLLCGDDFDRMLNPPPRRIRIDDKQRLTVPLRSSDVEIVVSKEALPITRFAAEELQRFLQRILDNVIPLTDSPTAGKISFICGLNSWSRAAGIDEKELTPESFIIRRSGRKIYIAGRDGKLLSRNHGVGKSTSPQYKVEEVLRNGYWPQFHEHATLFGVYEFLERFAGVRFYFPHALGTIVPRKPLVLPGFDIFERPDAVVRHFGGIYRGGWEDVTPGEKSHPFYAYHLSKERNLQAWRNRLQTMIVPSMHGLASYQLGRRFGKEHPEYFALRTDGRRQKDPEFSSYSPHFCYHGGAADEIYRDAEAALTGKKPASRGIKLKNWDPSNVQDGFFDIGFADGMYLCRCARCSAVFAKGAKAVSSLLWSFLCPVGEKLRKNKIPGRLAASAYAEATEVPECDIPDNIIVMLALPGPWYWDRSSERGKLQRRLIREWHQKIGRRFSLYTYTDKYDTLCVPFVPNVTPRHFGRYFADTAKYTIGATTQGATDRYLFNYLNAYIMGKMQWNAGSDFEAMLKEHHRLMFGKAAGVMEGIFDTFEQLWCGRIAGRMVDTSVGPKPVAPSESQIWREIYSPAVLKKLAGEFDRAEKMAASDRPSLDRIRYIRSQLFSPMEKYAAAFLAKNNAADAFKLPMYAVREKVVPEGGKVLPDRFWDTVPVMPLRPFKPQEGTVYPETQVQFAEDDEYFLIRFRCAEPDRKVMDGAFKWKNDSREIWADNIVELFLAPAGRGSRYYQLMVNSRGSFTDCSITPLGASFETDYKWSSGADVAVSDGGKFWIAEIRIRKSNLPGFEKGSFRANFARTRPGKPSLMWSSSPFLEKRYHEPENWAEFQRRKSPEANLVKNGSFEKLLSPSIIESWAWDRKLPPENFVGQDDQESVLGRYSLKLASSGKMPPVFSASQRIAGMKPNTRYRVSFFVKYSGVVPRSRAAGVCLNVNDAGNRWFPYPRLNGTSRWIFQSFEFTSGAATNAKYVPYVSCAVVGCEKGTVWFDGVTMAEVK